MVDQVVVQEALLLVVEHLDKVVMVEITSMFLELV
jgi:hypothetical protein